MKKFNRVLAMVLALITVLAMLPISAIADTWLDVDAEKEQTGNVTSTDITVTVDPYALLSYLQDGDWVGLLKGMSASGGLDSIITKDEFFAIVPKEELVKLVEMILEDVDTAELLDCFDINELFACFDREEIIDLFLGLDNLQSYVKDYDALMSYVDVEDIEAAISYIDTKALLEDYAEELIDLALGLEIEKLFEIVDLDAAVNLAGFDFAAAADQDYFVNVVAKAENLADYVDLDAIEAIINDLTYEDIKVYINEDVAELILKKKAKTDEAFAAALFVGAECQKYWEDYPDELNLAAIYADKAVLLTGNIDDLFLNGYTDGETTYAPAFNLSAILFGDKANGIDPMFDFADLINKKYVNIEKLAEDFTYSNLVVIDNVKQQIAVGKVSARDVVGCIKNYSAAIEAVGVVNAIEAIGSYQTVVNDYVSNVNGLIKTFDLTAIADAIISDRKINEVFNVVDMVEAVGVKKIATHVQFKKLGKMIYESGVIETLVGMLDVKEYLVQAFNIFAGVQKNVAAIEIDGVVITEQNESGYIQLVPARVIDALENLVPSLGELANLDDSGKLFNASFAISYYADETGEVVNTKVVNFNFVLTAGTDMIRKAAAKLAVVLDKIGYVDLVGGEIVADITIPSEFATVLRKTLEKLADSSDPKMNAIKDKVLTAYSAQPDDFIAFAQGLTFEEVMAVLDAIDPALFGEVYNKALASRYAEVLLAYVERVTGYDLSDNLEVQYFVTAISEIPTFEDFIETLEEITEIEILYLLPSKVNGYLDHTAYEVIEKLADVFGYEFDMSNLLKAAAATADPFGYLYTAVINKVENFGGAYAFVQRNAIRVANRLMATRFGATIADNCLLDFYAGNSTFVFDKDDEFNAKQVLRAILCRSINVIDDYKPGLASKLEFYLGEFLDMIVSDNASAHAGFEITVHVNNIYRVTYVDAMGVEIKTVLLPAGTDLSKMVDCSKVDGFNGWVDVATDKFITVVPNKDVVVQADVAGISTHTVTVEFKYGEETRGTVDLEVLCGTPLNEEYLKNLLVANAEVVEGFYPELTTEEDLLGYAYTYNFNETVWPVVEENLTIVANITLDTTEGNIKVDNDSSIKLNSDNWIVAVEWDKALNFTFDRTFIKTVAALGHNIVLTAQNGVQKITLNNDVLKQLDAKADAHPVAVETIVFTYGEVVAAYAKGEAYEVGFNFNDDNEAIDLGDFTTAVEIILPFTAGINEDDAKTFVYVDGTELMAGVGVTLANGTVKFDAPHFSTITIVNKYSFAVELQYKVEGVLAGVKLPDANGRIATLVNADGTVIELNAWYAEGEKIVGKFVDKWQEKGNEINNTPAGLVYDKTEFVTKGNVVTVFNGEFVMPAEAVTVTHYATTKTFHVYYYVNAELNKSLDYTILNQPTIDELKAYVPADETTTKYDWYVVGTLGEDDNVYLYWINSEKTEISVYFYADGKEAVITHTVADWREFGLVTLKAEIDAVDGMSGYIWMDDKGNQITDYTIEMLISSLGATDAIKFYGTKDTQNYHVFTDGNVKVDVDENGVPGDTTVTILEVINKNGYTATVKVYTTDGVEVEVTNGTFKMPYANVSIKVVYTLIETSYEYITIVVPADKAINATDITTLDTAPADLVLVKAERNADGDLELTYRYSVPADGFNKATFLKQVNALIASSQYLTTTYIVDGVAYTSETEALANLPEGATFAGWIEMSKNVKVAFLEYETEETNTAWLIVCIILAILLIVALITLIYVLHVSDRMGTSWLTKACTAIVTGFFAFCMFIAKVGLKILNLVGIKNEDILEELPAEPVEDIPAVLLNPEAVVAEEEVAVEETVAEVAEEAVEEVAEETTEEN